MGDRPILSVVQPITIDTMLNNNGLKNVTCTQGFRGCRGCSLGLFYLHLSLGFGKKLAK